MVCACLPVCWPLIILITKRGAVLAQKQWHRISGWTLIGNGNKKKTRTSNIEGESTSNPGDSLFMDDLSHRRVTSREPV
jgi:hypothetical protein